MRRLGLLLLASACGPSVADAGATDDASGESDADASEDGDGTTTSTAATVGESTTGSGPVDSSSSTSDDGTTGAECPPPPAWLTWLACGSVPSRLAADDEAVYAVVDGDLLQVDHVAGGVEILIADSTARGLLRDGERLYWASFDEGEIGVVELATGEARLLATGRTKLNFLAADDAWVYATEYTEEGTVLRIPIAGGEVEPLYAGLDHPGPIVRDGTALYVVDSNDDANNPTPILRGSIDGAPLEPLVEAGGAANRLVLRDGRLYWTTYEVRTSALRAIDLAPGSAVEVLTETLYQPMGLALTADRIWWSEIGDMGDYQAVRSLRPADSTIDEYAIRGSNFFDIVATPSGVVVATSMGLALIDGS